MNTFLSAQQASADLGVSVWTISGWARSGLLVVTLWRKFVLAYHSRVASQEGRSISPAQVSGRAKVIPHDPDTAPTPAKRPRRLSQSARAGRDHR
jgi:hypothetical protein